MKKHLLSIYCLLAVCSLFAQKNKNRENTVVIPCSDFHITKPLSEIFANKLIDKKILKKGESDDRENRKSQKFRKSVLNGAQYGNDVTTMQRQMGVSPSRFPVQSWAGQSSALYPLDPSGAAGPNHYVQIINSTTFTVYDKTGTILLSGALGSLWTPATSNDGDPLVLYDKGADRWIMTQFGVTGNKIYIAISQTNDPTGAYYTYTYTSPAFPDYLKFSVWQDGYYMTSNQSPKKVFCFERIAMLAGIPTARSLYTTFSPPSGAGFNVPLPGDSGDGVLAAPGTPCPIFIFSDNGWGGIYTDAVKVYQMAVDWVPATPTGVITLAGDISTAAFDASYDTNWNDCPQPGTTAKLDGIGGTLMFRAQWKTWSGYNSVVLNWAVKISTTQRSIKWCELRQDQSTGIWTLYQEGIYAPDAATRWLGSIAMDDNGSIALCYLKSDATSIYPSLCYTGRTSSDPLGTLPLTEVLVQAGLSSQTSNNRSGDYSDTWLDPDGVTFWHTGEYIGAGGNEKTQIYSFQITSGTPVASISIMGANTICAGSSVTYYAGTVNAGTAPTYQWEVNGVNVGVSAPTFSSATLINGDTVKCIMTSSIAGATNNPATSNLIIISVNPADSASITYSSSNYCQTGNNPPPIITGTAGGIFNSTPAGLLINTSTGTINLAASPSATYAVTYTTAGLCPASSTFNLTLTDSSKAAFSYSGSFCQGGSDQSPSLSLGASAGIFSSTPAGLVFVNTLTGQIDLATTSLGTYMVTNTIAPAAGCHGISDSSIVNVYICDLWPGDANNDSLVDNYDLLPIGLFYFQSGPPRSTISNNWQAYPATNWGVLESNGSDIKHADCNGDGVIDNYDTLAINMNFSSIHAIVNNFNDEKTPHPNLYFVTSSSSYNAGDWVDAELWAGDSIMPSTNLYGIAFNINSDASFVQSGTESVSYTTGWLGTPGTNAITISKTDALTGTTYGGITRIDHTNITGYGKIADFKFKANINITSASVIHLSVSGYKANEVSGIPVLFNTPIDSITIIPLATDVTNTNNTSGFSIFPNPFTSQTIITFNEIQKNTTIKIMDVLGKEIKTAIIIGAKKLIIEKGEMPKGVYFVQVIDANKNMMNKKIVVQ